MTNATYMASISLPGDIDQAPTFHDSFVEARNYLYDVVAKEEKHVLAKGQLDVALKLWRFNLTLLAQKIPTALTSPDGYIYAVQVIEEVK